MFSSGKQFGNFVIDDIIYMNKPKTCVVFKSALPTGQEVAIKCLSIKHFSKQIQNESRVFREFKNNDKILSCIKSFRHGRFQCFVLPYAQKGDLYQYISKRENISEPLVKNIMFNILTALKDLHSKNFCHQDIKLENILLFENEASAVLCDFGSSEIINDGQKSSSILGSVFYLAPEILTSKIHDKSADIWALGVTLYILLSGELPFVGRNPSQLINDIKNRINSSITSTPALENVSDKAKDLINSMLQFDPEKRISASDALNSPWFDSSLEVSKANLVESHEELENIEVAI